MLAAYNVYFDIRFLRHELGRLGADCSIPHLCLMWMRPMLGLGRRCGLGRACSEFGIQLTDAHHAAADTLAAARLWQVYLEEIARREVRTFADLRRLKSYKFVKSFRTTPFGRADAERLGRGACLKSRRG